MNLLEPRLEAALLARERQALPGRLLRGLVHNLSGAVQLVRLPMDLLELRLGKANPEELRAKLAAAQEGMNRLNQELEALASQGGLAGETAPRVFGLADLVRDQLAIWRGDMFFKHEAAVEVAWAGAPLPVRAAPADVALALNALLQNALDALRAAERTRLWLRLRRCGARAVLGRRDEGPGPAPAMLASMFEPFAATRDRSRGAGPLSGEPRPGLEGAPDLPAGPAGGFLLDLPLAE